MPDRTDDLAWGVGAVSQRLGIAQATLRTWERRYQLGPSQRTSGGHRRYSAHDIERVDYMRRLLARGVTPREAARAAHELDPREVAALVAGEQPGDSSLTGAQAVDAVVEAVVDLDPARLTSLFGGALRRRGVVEAWDEVLAPALIRIGEAWSEGTIDVIGEHVSSERLMAELRLHTRAHPAPVSRTGVVLASGEEEQHSLPVFAVEAALAERGVGSVVLGSRVPWNELADLARRTGPDSVFVWATLPVSSADGIAALVDAVHGHTSVVLGGPGWAAVEVAGAVRSTGLADAIGRLAPGDRPATS
jgi:DNA-binding transcriptional MerR regulator